MEVRFSQLQLRDFGPYNGVQELTLTGDQPIVMVHGENMSGKSFLLNAIRWVLYGRALDRLGEVMSRHDLINRVASDSGNWNMSIKLLFEVDGMPCELERAIQARQPNITPYSDSDFEERFYFKRDGRFLTREEGQVFVTRVFPEQVSRFFLFDGEQLDEYEVLLSDRKLQSRIIKESIEDILGVPAIVHTINDLRENLRDAAKRQRNAAKKDDKASEHERDATQVEAEKDQLEETVRQLEERKNELKKDIALLNRKLKETEEVEDELIRLENYESQITEIRTETEQLQQDLKDKLREAWRDLVQPRIKTVLHDLEQEHEKQVSNLTRAAQLSAEVQDLEELLNSGKCPTCGMEQHVSHNRDAERKRAELEGELATLEFDPERQQEVAESIRRLRRLEPASVSDTITYIEQNLSRSSIALYDLTAKKKEISDSLTNHDKSEIANNRLQHIQLTRELGGLENEIEKKRNDIDEKRVEAAQHRAKISRTSSPAMRRLNREVELYDQLIDLFDHTKDELRDELKRSVEEDASSVFLELTTDIESYERLSINDHYGLTMIGVDGREAPYRSAGAEQVVALSLIAALNRNAVQRGPIIMDTPFGRLDTQHRKRILQFLPRMAQQVILLVTSGEVVETQDIEHIGHEVSKQYRINRINSNRSQILPMKG